MATGSFDEMSGYKFKQINHGDGTYSNYTQTFDANTISGWNYSNGATIPINIHFEKIAYSINFGIDNLKAGDIKVLMNSSETTYSKTQSIKNVTVENYYGVNYFAYAGFELKGDAFVINNGKKTYTLQEYSNLNIVQNYILTTTGVPNSTLYGTWLRQYFYVDQSYDVSNTSLGTITIQTCPITFNYGVKVYDPTNTTNNIIKTISDGTITLNETTGLATTNSVGTYLTYNSDAKTWYYKTEAGEQYALLNSRMFYPNGFTTTRNNYYTTYEFLLTTKPTKQFSLTSYYISYMVENFEEGKIIPSDDRRSYILLEVRKLLKINMKEIQFCCIQPSI